MPLTAAQQAALYYARKRRRHLSDVDKLPPETLKDKDDAALVDSDGAFLTDN